jgi:coenzyme Q-binding protein COQ10
VHDGQSRRVQEQGWLKGGQAGDVWKMEAELRAGAMGFEEGYVSNVEAKKWEKVSVSRLAPSSPPKLADSLPHCRMVSEQAKAKDTTIFKQLTTSWALTPQAPVAGRPLTKVELYIAYAFVSPFHAAAVSSVWEKVSGMMIGGFEKRMGDVYGR